MPKLIHGTVVSFCPERRTEVTGTYGVLDNVSQVFRWPGLNASFGINVTEEYVEIDHNPVHGTSRTLECIRQAQVAESLEFSETVIPQLGANFPLLEFITGSAMGLEDEPDSTTWLKELNGQYSLFTGVMFEEYKCDIPGIGVAKETVSGFAGNRVPVSGVNPATIDASEYPGRPIVWNDISEIKMDNYAIPSTAIKHCVSDISFGFGSEITKQIHPESTLSTNINDVCAVGRKMFVSLKLAWIDQTFLDIVAGSEKLNLKLVIGGFTMVFKGLLWPQYISKAEPKELVGSTITCVVDRPVFKMGVWKKRRNMKTFLTKFLGDIRPTIDPNVKTYYPFNESNGIIVKDYSNYHNNGTLKNGAKWGISQGGSGIIFDGGNDHIEDSKGRKIIRNGTEGLWEEVTIGSKTKIVGSGIEFSFYNDYYGGVFHDKKLEGQFISNFADYCTDLKRFNCEHNSFSGALPSFEACTNLRRIHCGYNSFSGTLPSFAACTEITQIFGHANNFTGTLPSFAACINLEKFNIHTNNFTGTLPSFAACTSLADFSVFSNSFTGTLPSFEACPDITDFSCSLNNFTGELPSFAACTVLDDFHAYLNNFTGALPSFAACTALIAFYCYSNNFTGSLPSFATCTALERFYCDENNFTGALPSFAACTALRTFYCDTNNFTGALPPFATCTGLTSFCCHSNDFSGALQSFEASTSLYAFTCDKNNFSGTLPSFAACTTLGVFYCDTNNFTGTLPSFAACPDLYVFYGNSNAFTNYEAGGFATQIDMDILDMSVNALAVADINAILADLRTSYDLENRVACTAKLEGGTNGVPTGQGVTDRDFLNSHGWTVTTN